jgi:hypothetical protein
MMNPKFDILFAGITRRFEERNVPRGMLNDLPAAAMTLLSPITGDARP